MSIDLQNLKVGDRVWSVDHYTVTEIDADGWYHLEPEEGDGIRAKGKVLEGHFHSVTKYKTTEKVSTTDMVKRIKQAGHGDFQVTFNKKVDNGKFAEQVQAAVQRNEFGDTEKKRKRWMNDNLKGEERVMKARLRRNPDTKEALKDQAGRIPVYDLEARGGRLIDERTITELIMEGVRYQKK
jgi:hypothetical protein